MPWKKIIGWIFVILACFMLIYHPTESVNIVHGVGGLFHSAADGVAQLGNGTVGTARQ